jgi:DNA polymerase III epsilon subunit-like protein
MENKPKYLAFDCESGGLVASEYSLLTVYFAVYSETLNKLDSLYLYVKPNDEIYRLDAGSMDVNQINIIEHNKIAKTEAKCGQELWNFLKKWSNGGAIKLIPLGHGITLDINWVHEHLVRKLNLEQFTSYRKIDTAVIAQFMKDFGMLPDSNSGSLVSLAEYFDIKFKVHDAAEDTETTVEVYRQMVQCCRSMLETAMYPIET